MQFLVKVRLRRCTSHQMATSFFDHIFGPVWPYLGFYSEIFSFWLHFSLELQITRFGRCSAGLLSPAVCQNSAKQLETTHLDCFACKFRPRHLSYLQTGLIRQVQITSSRRRAVLVYFYVFARCLCIFVYCMVYLRCACVFLPPSAPLSCATLAALSIKP